jgi:hypothetical protein
VAKTFEAKVGSWTKQTQERLTAVFRQSAQTVVEEVQKTKDRGGHMPVDTGFLRASLMASTSYMPSLIKDAQPTKGQTYQASNATSLVIAGASQGKPVYLGFTANYAMIQENKNGFVRLTAQRWQQIVTASVKLIKSRVEGS